MPGLDPEIKSQINKIFSFAIGADTPKKFSHPYNPHSLLYGFQGPPFEDDLRKNLKEHCRVFSRSSRECSPRDICQIIDKAVEQVRPEPASSLTANGILEEINRLVKTRDREGKHGYFNFSLFKVAPYTFHLPDQCAIT